MNKCFKCKTAIDTNAKYNLCKKCYDKMLIAYEKIITAGDFWRR